MSITSFLLPNAFSILFILIILKGFRLLMFSRDEHDFHMILPAPQHADRLLIFFQRKCIRDDLARIDQAFFDIGDDPRPVILSGVIPRIPQAPELNFFSQKLPVQILPDRNITVRLPDSDNFRLLAGYRNRIGERFGTADTLINDVSHMSDRKSMDSLLRIPYFRVDDMIARF